MKTIIFLTLIILFTGCTKKVSEIEPLISNIKYEAIQCTELTKLHTKEQSKLKKAIVKQEADIQADLITTSIILIPMTPIFGNHEKEVAQSKGEVIAIEREMKVKGCER